MKRLLCLLAGFLIIGSATGQSVTTRMGARENAMGYSSSTLSGTWSLFNNVAGLASLKNTSVSFTYDAHPNLAGANRTAGAFAMPLQVGAIGAGVYKFGDDLYSETIISGGYANQFGLAALGAQINYIQYRTEGFGSKGVLSLNLGGIAELTPQFLIGAYIQNINQPAINEEDRLPTKLVAGLGFKPTDKIILTTEIEKDLDYDPLWKMGFEYKFHEKFFARTGFNLNPNAAFFGLGFKAKKFSIDYALQHQVVQNFSHQASLLYQFKK